MPNCQSIDPLVTPYIDGQLDEPDRRRVDEHLGVCPPCHARVAAERAISDLIRERKPTLRSECASRALHRRCAEVARLTPRAPALDGGVRGLSRAFSRVAWSSRLAPLAAAASLVLIVGTAFLYQLTASSSRVMAAELAADHVKCFAINGILQTHETPAAVESSMLTGFGWRVHLPDETPQLGLELVGARPCLYGEGKIAHIMYRHRGEPVSLFMLPRTMRSQDLVEVLGHQAAIWCANDRTFVLVTRERKEEAARMASVVQASLR